MPFDNANLSNIVQHRIGWCGMQERDADGLIPYFDHYESDIIALKNGGVMAMLKLEPLPFNLENNSTRNGSARRHFALYQLLADPQTEIYEHAVCHKNITPFAGQRAYATPYANAFLDRYEQRALAGVRQLDWFVTVIVHPKPFGRAWLENLKRTFITPFQSFAPPVIDRSQIRLLNSKLRTIRTAFQKQNPVRLGTYNKPNSEIVYSEIGRALHLMRTTKLTDIPLMQPAGTLAASLYRERVTHGTLGFVVPQPGGGMTRATVGRVYGMNTYPKKPRVGMLDKLWSDADAIKDARWVMTNGVRPLSRAKASANLELTLNRMEDNENRASTAQSDLENALDELSDSQEIRAQHVWSFCVHADDMPTLDEHSSALVDILADAGCSPAPVGIASEAMYWMQWPGNRHLCSQPATIGLRRLTALSPLEGHSVGVLGQRRQFRWGAPLLRYMTAGGTAYDHELADGQILHCLYLGPSGSGKTAAIGANLTAATPLLGPKGTALVLDKDRSQRLTILNNGGSYTELKRGEDSGAAPLRRLRNNGKDRTVLTDLILGMIRSDGGAEPTERVKRQVAQGVAFEMGKPPELRSIGGVHAWLPTAQLDPSDSANRLKPWCRGERLGWAFDGAAGDSLDFDCRMAGVDYTALLGDTMVMPTMAAYLFYLAGKVMDGRRFILVAEELKFLLPKPEYTVHFEDALLTGRKKNVGFWPSIQQPEELLTHPIGPTVLAQCRKRFLFKNELANRDAYCGRVGGPYGDGLHCTPQEYQQIREGMTVGSHSILIQQPGSKSVLARFDLSCMPEDLAIISGTPKSNDLWDDVGEKLAAQRTEFLNRIEEAAA